MNSRIREIVTQLYLRQLLKQVFFPVVEIVEHFRPSRIAFPSRNKSFSTVLGDQLVDKFRDTLIRLDPIAVPTTEHRIFDIRERRFALQIAQPFEEIRGVIGRLAC